MMRHIFRSVLPALLMLVIVSCKKDKNVLGVEVQPAQDELNAEHLDGLTVTAHSIMGDSIASFNQRFKFLGSNNDPVFGKTDVGLYTNMSINVSNLDFGPTATLTSAEIVFAVDAVDYIGDPKAVLNASVFPMNQKLDTKSLYYYASNNRMHDPTPLFTSPVTFTTSGSNGQALIKLQVDPAFATALMQDTANIKNNDLFQNKYKGFYISTSISGGGEGVIYTADLDNDLSGFYLYYKDHSAAQSDSTFQFKFMFSGSTAVKYNTVKYDASTDVIAAAQDSLKGGDKLFLKGLGGTKLKLQIPFLKSKADSFPVSINRAELVLYVDQSLTAAGTYTPPPQLTLLATDSLGRESFILDQGNSTDFARYGGSYDADNKRYVFNIAREAQAILSGHKKNRSFYLVASNITVALRTLYETSTSKDLISLRRDEMVERVVFAGYNNTLLRPRLNLSYVKLPKEVR